MAFVLDMGATMATVQDGFALTHFLNNAVGKEFALELGQPDDSTRVALITRAMPILTPTTTPGTQWHKSEN
jgi:hypothetical protein